MIEPAVINPQAVYDDGSLRLALGISLSAISRARKAGRLQSKREGNRTLYMGQWVLDWLSRDSSPKPEVAPNA